MKELSNDQIALLRRTLGRMEKMGQKPTPFILSLSLRANDCPPESLEQVRSWLEKEQQFSAKPAPESTHQVGEPDAGAHEKIGAEKNMAGNANTANVQQPTTQAKNWMEIDDENSTGSYVSFKSGDRKILKIVSNPIAGQIEFKQPNGTMKSNFGLTIQTLEGDNPEIKEWSVTSKQIRDQLKAICRIEGLINGEMAGSIIRVAANGDGLQRTYFVEMVQRPDGRPAKGYAMPSPQPQQYQQPVNANPGQAAQVAQDAGQQWLNGQRQGAQ